MKPRAEKHQATYPTARTIRRACKTELYRTIKRLNVFIPQDKAAQAEKLYFQKVAANLIWIHEHRDNRKQLADWWEAQVCPEIAALWEIEPKRLADAFRSAFGG